MNIKIVAFKSKGKVRHETFIDESYNGVHKMLSDLYGEYEPISINEATDAPFVPLENLKKFHDDKSAQH